MIARTQGGRYATLATGGDVPFSKEEIEQALRDRPVGGKGPLADLLGGFPGLNL